jgi:two-component system, NarL family, nitrate/nitrite response regulator NarL
LPDPIRIVVVDDHPMFREAAVQMLAHADGIEVVGEGATAADALKVAKELLPDVILLDVRLPGSGVEAAARIDCVCPDVRTIMLTASENEQDVTSALQAGARGYILKDSSGSEVVETVRAIYRGDTYVAPHLAARLLIKKSKQIEIVVNDNLHHLITSREEEIFALVSVGMSNKEVARRRKTASRRNLRLEAPPVGEADFDPRKGCTENHSQSRDLRSLKTLRF